MKKAIFVLAVLLTAFTGQAQKLDKAKKLVKENKLAEAKTEIDNFLAIEKNKGNSDAWYMKAKIYLAIAGNAELKSSVPDARDITFSAIKEYYEIEGKIKDSTKRYLVMVLENNAPLVALYQGYSNDGATFYNASNFNDALTSFEKTLDIFDFMVQKRLLEMSFDTTTVLYAGISAEKANKLDDAAKYYGMIAERKINNEGFIEIYKWLADHYGKKGDMATSSKFTQLGRTVYPTDTWWDGYDLELVREKGTQDDLFKKYEEVIANNPDNHLFVFNYGVELYQAGYDQDSSKRPANSKELIARARKQFEKAISLKPEYPNAQMVLGQLIYNEGVDISSYNKTIRPPAGGRLKPEELKKKEDLRKLTAAKFDEATPYFLKVEQLLGNEGKLKMEDRNILKDAYDLLIIIYENANNKDKAAEYTDKYNGVDKKHS